MILPLVAIATPATYVREPLRVFELDFEANLPIVRACVEYRKRLIFPSTSEVYGMCQRRRTSIRRTSNLVYGPINKPRWIYACSKQMMDRVIAGYGQRTGLNYTLFRPFNWIGSGLDSINTTKEGSSRVLTQFLGHIVRGEPIKLVDGGQQKRSFTHIDDGIDALMAIIDNKDGIATGKIYNIGNPVNNFSVRELATDMLALAAEYPEYAESAKKVQLVDVHLAGLLRQRLSGRAEPRAQDRQHLQGSQLAAARGDGRRTAAHLRGVSRPCRRSAQPGRIATPRAVTEFEIRPARAQDIPHLLRLIQGLAEFEGLTHLYENTPQRMHAALFGPHPSGEALLVWPQDEANAAPVAFALFFQNLFYVPRQARHLPGGYLRRAGTARPGYRAPPSPTPGVDRRRTRLRTIRMGRTGLECRRPEILRTAGGNGATGLAHHTHQRRGAQHAGRRRPSGRAR